MTRTALPAALAVAVATAVFTADSAARAGWWDDAGVPRRMQLDALLGKPDSWVDVPVVLRVAYAGRAASPDPYFTRFTERRWRPLRFWSADLPEIDRAKAEPFARLFVRRGAPTDRRAARLERGDAVDVHAVVRDVVRGVPWFEVLEVTGRGDPLTVLETAERDLGDRFGRLGNEAAAERIYRRLLASRELPPEDRADLERRIGIACGAQGKWAAAVKALHAAQVLAPDDGEIEEELLRARRRARTDPAPKKEPRREPPAETARPPKPGVRPPAGLGDVPTSEEEDEEKPEPDTAPPRESPTKSPTKSPTERPRPAPLPKPPMNEPK